MERQYRLTVNGLTRDVTTEPYQTLLDTVRDRLGLTGSKKGCNEGECASCTMIVDGLPVNSCLVLIGDAVGKEILTIEGLMSKDGRPHAMQQAFVDFGGAQCGYCTPGMIVSACALVTEHPNPTTEEINFYLAGNVCRCTGYNKITEAVHSAAKALQAPPVNEIQSDRRTA